MIWLGIKTDAPLAEFFLYEGEELRAKYAWQADRQLAFGLLGELESFLKKNGLAFSDVDGLFAFRGPGSFTGLRIGITVMNTMSYSLGVPIVGASGSSWYTEAVSRLQAGHNDEVIVPEYGAEARITKPRK